MERYKSDGKNLKDDLTIARKIIIFDLGGILETHDVTAFCAWMKKRFNIAKNIELIYKKWEFLLDTGKIGEKDLHKKFTEELGISISKEEFYNEYYKNHVVRHFDVLNFIKEKLAGRYKLYLFSNYAKTHRSKFKEKYDYEKLFEKCIYSFDIGVKKPDPLFFQKGLKRINHKGEECIYFDDQLKSKEIAEKLGIVFIRYKNLDQLKAELTTLKLI